MSSPELLAWFSLVFALEMRVVRRVDVLEKAYWCLLRKSSAAHLPRTLELSRNR